MDYAQSVRYLMTLGRELASPQHARAAKFDLHNIRVLCARLGDPQHALRCVHVAGTNGKGSTCAMLASILNSAGLRTGLYTSPHLLRINERIRIAGAEISDADFAAEFTRVHQAIEELLASGTLPAHPTFFECLTAMAFDYFARQNTDLAVIEVGMGGRLDSTNIITPDVAIITQIDFDHENFLGHSIEAIAAEKAGIIKRGIPVVSAAAHPAAKEIVRRRAAELNATLVDIDEAIALTNLHAREGCYSFDLASGCRRGASCGEWAPARLSLRIRLALPGRFQVQNAAAAIAAAQILAARQFPIDDSAIAQGLASVQWAGRLQRLQERPAVYVDGTHNPAGARELLKFWEESFAVPGRSGAGPRIHLIYGAMRDKAVDEVAGLLFPRAATVILTQSPQPRSISAATLASLTRHLARAMEVIPEPASALERALEAGGPDDVIFATGSLYLAGDLLQAWAKTAKAAALSSATQP